jgi:DNA-binding NtrC family response regulator
MPVETRDRGNKFKSALPGAAPSAIDLQSAKPIRILVIDDETAICDVIKLAFAATDFQVETVGDARQIAKRLQGDIEEPYDLVLLDYHVPGVQSQQVFSWLRERQPAASVIVITGQPSFDSAVDSLRAKAFDYLTKPFSVADLRRVVMRCLAAKGLLRLSEGALREALGRSIRERRKAMDLTLVQLASRSDVSVGYLSQVELGRNSASIETLYRVCLALGWKLSELFQVVQRDP